MKQQQRIKQSGEVFTPRSLIRDMLGRLPNSVWFDPNKTWLEPSAGDGNFLVEIKARLLQAGHDEKHILDNMIFSVELIDDNHWVLQHRLGYLVDGLPNSKFWTEEEQLVKFKISKIHSLSQDLNKNNPYHEKLGLEKDEVMHHINHVCWNTLEYDMSFSRSEQPVFNLPLLQEFELGDWPQTDTPNIGEKTVVENVLGFQPQLAHNIEPVMKEKIKKEPKEKTIKPLKIKEAKEKIPKQLKEPKEKVSEQSKVQGNGKGGWAVHPKYYGTSKKIRSIFNGQTWEADHDAIVDDINTSLKEKGKKDLFEDPRPFSASSGIRGGDKFWKIV